MTALTEGQLAHASRSLPRYTSYPTALAFQPAPDDALTRLAGRNPADRHPLDLRPCSVLRTSMLVLRLPHQRAERL